ncbi:Hypothetical_protein [Hexamita inflata]|uniref:Hypothetical_protein n=1 Tax=Hexamita inflata TaxID=28002 RepID=A0AA86PY42_9EUKA|nr:Hypothetical protein HINF_LOCUS33912 [Hexamita inflata]
MKLIQYFNLESLSSKATRQLAPGEYWSIITHVILSILGIIDFIVFSLPNNSIWCNLFSTVLLFYTILQQVMCAVTCSLMNPGYVVETVKAPIEIEEVESSTVRIEEMNLNEYNCDACDDEIVATPENDPLYEYHPLKQAVNHEASDSFDQDDDFNPLIYDHSIQHQTVNQQPSPQAIENFCLICYHVKARERAPLSRVQQLCAEFRPPLFIYRKLCWFEFVALFLQIYFLCDRLESHQYVV